MKRKFLIIAIGLLGITVYASYTLFNSEQKDKLLLQVLTQSLRDAHFDPQVFNDEFSVKAFDMYLDRMDYSKRFLLQEDVDSLSLYQTKIDDEINANSLTFFEMANRLIESRQQEAEAYFEEILNEPFDFSVKESREADAEKRTFAATSNELKESWRLDLKYQVINRIYNAEKAQNEPTYTKEKKSFEDMEKEARAKILTNHQDWFHRIAKLNKNDRYSTYLNAIANTFDPHTSYFPPRDKENFDISMSGQFEGIGATLQQRDQYIRVTQIVPGSASARQGELEAEDIILAVAQAKDEPVDVVDMRLDDAVQLIRGKKGTEVRLTIKKTDGTVKIVPIIRDVVVLEETYAKSAVLEHTDEKLGKYGYIYLPKFYADFNKRNGRHCSEDVLTEIEKLKGENVEGLIIDLRNNGGGSLSDVVDMAGLFIKKGPVVQIKARGRSPQILDDKDKEVQYDGPLVIMVNEFSASASEILAAAMQDYKRAVIVGGNATFGKGTVQRFYDFDKVVPASFNNYKPFGAIKLTIQKFYRINGGATQLRGVIPDIILPDRYAHLDIGERDQDFPMKWDEIAPASYSLETDLIGKLTVAKKNSTKRVKQHDDFKLIAENALRYKRMEDETVIPLKYNTFVKYRKNQEKEAKRFEGVGKSETGLKASLSYLDNSQAVADTLKMARFKSWEKLMKKDIYLDEAVRILADIQ